MLERVRVRERVREREREFVRESSREFKREFERETERERQTDRQRDRETDRERFFRRLFRALVYKFLKMDQYFLVKPVVEKDGIFICKHRRIGETKRNEAIAMKPMTSFFLV